MHKIQNDLQYLNVLSKCTPKMRKSILNSADGSLVTSICECVLNCINGNIQLDKNTQKRLAKYKKVLRELATKQNRLKSKKKKDILVQKGGFLPIILPAAISVLANLLTK